jgi:general secretion pathway protein J
MKTRDHDGGFTLIEMLVAMSLLALIAAYGVSTLRTLSHVKTIEAGMDLQNVTEATRNHLRATLGDARVVFDVNDRTGTVVVFEGKQESVTAVAPLDDRTVRGGLYKLRYHLVGKELVLDYALLRPQGQTPANGQVVLVGNVKSLSIDYFGASDGSGQKSWATNWQGTDQLPERIRLSLQLEQAPADTWTPLEIALKNVN